MPLITIYCTTDYCPADEAADDTERQGVTYAFGAALPQLVVDHCEQLHLDPAETPLEGVQVDFVHFHRRGINIVPVGIKVEFAENPPSLHNQNQIREALEKMIRGWYFDNCPREHLPPIVALDSFWGPDKGFLASDIGSAGTWTKVIRW